MKSIFILMFCVSLLFSGYKEEITIDRKANSKGELVYKKVTYGSLNVVRLQKFNYPKYKKMPILDALFVDNKLKLLSLITESNNFLNLGDKVIKQCYFMEVRKDSYFKLNENKEYRLYPPYSSNYKYFLSNIDIDNGIIMNGNMDSVLKSSLKTLKNMKTKEFYTCGVVNKTSKKFDEYQMFENKNFYGDFLHNNNQIKDENIIFKFKNNVLDDLLKIKKIYIKEGLNE